MSDTVGSPDMITSKKKRLKPRIFLLVAIILLIAALIVGWFYFNKQSPEAQQKVSSNSQITSEESNREIMEIQDVPNATVDQKYILLMTKIGAAEAESNWQLVKDYASRALSLQGHSQDIAALLKLASAQKQLGDTDGYKETQTKIGQYNKEHNVTTTQNGNEDRPQ